jgi:cysteine desulfurase/selenocysteine lyase
MLANPVIGPTSGSIPRTGAGGAPNDAFAPGGRRAPNAACLDVNAIRADFHALWQEVRPGVALVYLDSAATSLKPWPVIRALQDYDADYPASVHRGLHTLSERATQAYESARVLVERYIGALDPAQVIFTRGTTESINLVAQSWGGAFLRPGDEVLLTILEHHSNLVPWQMLARRRGLALKFVDVTDDGRLDLESFERQLAGRVRLVAVTAMSNVLGTIPPLREIVDRAHEHGALVVIDAAQGMAHAPFDVTALDADFVAFSGHKLCGPTGVGVLYAKREHLEAMPPVMGGGSMVVRVDRKGAEWNDVPWRFEAGTPPIAQAIGLGAAVQYLGRFDRSSLLTHMRNLTRHAHGVLGGLAGVRVLGPDPEFESKGGIISFLVEGVHPHDLAQLLDHDGLAIRAGHHCAMPLHERLGIAASARASFALYNTIAEIDRLAESVERARWSLRRPREQAKPPRPEREHARHPVPRRDP